MPLSLNIFSIWIFSKSRNKFENVNVLKTDTKLIILEGYYKKSPEIFALRAKIIDWFFCDEVSCVSEIAHGEGDPMRIRKPSECPLTGPRINL